MKTAMDIDDKKGVKEPGEGTKAEEAKDAREMKGATKPMLPKMPMGRIAQRSNKVNRSQVI